MTDGNVDIAQVEAHSRGLGLGARVVKCRLGFNGDTLPYLGSMPWLDMFRL
jgi:hypothetical protein